MNIRQAVLKDFKKLTRLVKAFYVEENIQPHDDSQIALKRLIIDSIWGYVYIAEQAEEPVGYAVVTRSYSLESGGPTAFLDELYVVPAAREQGVGRALVGHVLQTVKNMGAHSIYLEMSDSNSRKAQWYGSFGFEPRPYPLMVYSLKKN